MIELKNIYKWVNSGGNRIFLLRDINLTIKEGEFVSIMGPSGSFRTAEVRIGQGAISTFDYVIAKNNLDHVLINLVSIKYNYLLRTKLLDFYQDKALW